MTIDGEEFFKTGDLARYNTEGVLVFVGRADFQIKIRGQRMEPSEVELVLMQIVNKCVVVKRTHLDDDIVVAYVETTKTVDDLRQHCLSHLPLYMVPSLFIILDKIPQNENGKIDRHALPPLDFSSLSVSDSRHQQPQTDMEKKVHTLWCQLLPHLTLISTSKSLFELGGTSLTIMKLFYFYQTTLKRNVKVGDLFQHSTIINHAHLLEQQTTFEDNLSVWYPLNLTEGTTAALDIIV